MKKYQAPELEMAVFSDEVALINGSGNVGMEVGWDDGTDLIVQ